MGAALDPEQQRVANMRRRAYMLEKHEKSKGPDGKSTLARKAGRVGGQRTAERHGGGSAWGLRMALHRWHGVPLPTHDGVSGAENVDMDGGARG
jgi:hypothetical protein